MKIRPEEKVLAEKALQHGFRLYRVGGSIRDELLGLVAADYDYVAIGSDDDDVICEFTDSITEDGYWGNEFPVFRFWSKDLDEKVEISFDRDIMTNLAGRDTTMNAMAVDVLSGELIDPFGGRSDIEMGVARYVTVESFNPLAAFRLARQCAQLFAKTGRVFWPDGETMNVMQECNAWDAPEHRIRYEYQDACRLSCGEVMFIEILESAGIQLVLDWYGIKEVKKSYDRTVLNIPYWDEYEYDYNYDDSASYENYRRRRRK